MLPGWIFMGNRGLLFRHGLYRQFKPESGSMPKSSALSGDLAFMQRYYLQGYRQTKPPAQLSQLIIFLVFGLIELLKYFSGLARMYADSRIFDINIYPALIITRFKLYQASA